MHTNITLTRSSPITTTSPMLKIKHRYLNLFNCSWHPRNLNKVYRRTSPHWWTCPQVVRVWLPYVSRDSTDLRGVLNTSRFTVVNTGDPLIFRFDLRKIVFISLDSPLSVSWWINDYPNKHGRNTFVEGFSFWSVFVNRKKGYFWILLVGPKEYG